VPNKDDVADEVAPLLRKDDLVMVMGAGDIRTAGESLLSKLAATPCD
jgi:UDP-N-acetylmuramate-alanine ligase